MTPIQTAQQVIDLDTATQLAEMFSALSDPSRLRIISALAHAHGELNVSELSERVSMSESATSHQLRLLRTQRIVRARKSGRQVFYSLDDGHIHDLFSRGLAHLEHE